MKYFYARKHVKVFLLSFFIPQFFFITPVSPVTYGSDAVVSYQGAANISGVDNELLGFAYFASGFSFADASTTCSFNSLFPVGGDVFLSGGDLHLKKKLIFDDSCSIATGGTFYGNHHVVQFPKKSTSLRWPVGQLQLSSVLDSKAASDGVYSVDWSYDNKYLAVGTETSGDDLQIYSFNGSVLTLVDSLNLGDHVLSVHWHPSQHYLAVGRDSASDDDFRVYRLDLPSENLVLVDGVEMSADVRSVAWSTDGDYVGIGTDNSSYELRVYSFASEVLSQEATVNLSYSRDVEEDALAWDASGSYLAVGLSYATDDENPIGKEFCLYSFNGSSLTYKDDVTLNEHVHGVAWNHVYNVIAIGTNAGTETLRIYDFDTQTETISEITSARIGETKKVFAVAWSPDGKYLAMGANESSTSELRIYRYDHVGGMLSLIEEQEYSLEVTTVRWTHDGVFLAIGNSMGSSPKVEVYRFDSIKKPFCFIDTKLDLHSPVDFITTNTFAGTCIINGNGHEIALDPGVGLVVQKGSSLHLKNVILKNISGTNIRCLDSQGTIILENVMWVQDNDYHFSNGAFNFVSDVLITGAGTFAYESDQVSTLFPNTILKMDWRMTLSYAPSIAADNLFAMTDETSHLVLNNATLFATAAGLNLTKGTLQIHGRCDVHSDATAQVQGIVFGDGLLAQNDVHIDIEPSGQLEVSSGYVVYKNVN